MDTDRINKWLSLFANLGVVVGIAILIVEIEQANSLAEADVLQRRSDSIADGLRDYALSDYLPAITVKYQDGGVDALTAVEFSRYFAWESARRVRMASQYTQFRLGYLDRETAETTFQFAAENFLDTWNDIGLAPPGPDTLEFMQEVERARR